MQVRLCSLLSDQICSLFARTPMTFMETFQLKSSISNKLLLISNLLLLAPAACANIGSGICHNYVHTLEYSEYKHRYVRHPPQRSLSQDFMPLTSPFPTKHIPQLLLCPQETGRRKQGEQKIRLQWRLSPQLDLSLWKRVGIYSPKACLGNVIVFNSLLTYPGAKP